METNNLPEQHKQKELRHYGVPKIRKKVIDMLNSAFSTGDLELEEYERRIELAEKAKTINQLEEIIKDFPEELNKSINSSDIADKKDVVFTIIGDREVSVEDNSNKINAITVIGDLSLDFTDTKFNQKVLKTKVFSFMGDTIIKIPKDMKVKRKFFTLIGDIKYKKAKNTQDKYNKILIINGFKLIGDLIIMEEQ